MKATTKMWTPRPLSWAIASLCTMEGAAFAQAPASAAAQPAAVAASSPTMTQAQDESDIQRVVVTARRREESLQDVPVAVTAFSAKELERLNVQNLSDLQGHVPDLEIYAARGSNTTVTAFIRGVGQADPTWGVDAGVGIYLDDVYMARPQGAMLDVFDTQRIEVLRGPQGTLYGKNTIGGAIKYVSRPLSVDPEASVSVALGSHGQENLKVSAGGSVDDGQWRARVALATLHHDGFGHNIATGQQVSNQDTLAGRASIGYFSKALPLTVQLSVDYAEDSSHERGFQRLAASPFDPAHTPPMNSRYDIDSDMPDVNYTHNHGASLTASYGLSDAWTLKSITASRGSNTDTTIDFDGLPLPIANVSGLYRDHQNTEELQLLYDDGRGQSGVLGLYYFNGLAGGDIYSDFLSRQFGTTAGTVYTTSKSAYADWSFQLAPRWNLAAGIRFTDETKHAVVLNQLDTDATFSTPIAALADFDKSRTAKNTAPKVSLDFKASDSTHLYASASEGFKSGGYNIRANTLAVPISSKPYDDETLYSYEVGSKTSLDEGRFEVNTALFHNNYRNIQLSVFTSYTQADGSPGFFGDFTNAGKAHVNGGEIELAWHPTPHWNASANFSYLDTVYDQYISSGVNIANKERFSNAPKDQLGLNVEYVARPDGAGVVRSRIGYTYQSKVYPTTDLSEALAQKGYGLYAAGVVWEKDKHWTFSLEGSNLTDVRYKTDGYNIAALGILDAYYGPPRMISASATYKY
jgi:iron complex outermembrane receptor protein